MNTTSRNFLKWELCWIPAEIAMVGLGLFLLLGLELPEAGTLILFAAVAISATVRWLHYSGAGRQKSNDPTA